MECKACRSSKLVLILMIIIVAALAYKAFFVPIASTPVTKIAELSDTAKNELIAPQTPALDAQEINLMIQDYLVNHPEDIIRALEVMQKKKLQAMQAESEQIIQNRITDIENDDAMPVLGNKDGNVKIVYFYDYNCNYCIKASQTFDQILADNPNIKLIYKPLPYLGEGSEYIARIILAINKTSPEKVKTLHDILLSSQLNSAQEIVEVLEANGLDAAKIVELSNSDGIKDVLMRNFTLAQEIDIKGVPVYVINGKYYTGVIRAGQIQDILNAGDTPVAEDNK